MFKSPKMSDLDYTDPLSWKDKSVLKNHQNQIWYVKNTRWASYLANLVRYQDVFPLTDTNY